MGNFTLYVFLMEKKTKCRQKEKKGKHRRTNTLHKHVYTKATTSATDVRLFLVGLACVCPGQK